MAGDSNGFESDNFNPGIGRLPITKTVFSNITVLGPKRDGTVALPVGEKFERGIFIRRNSGISIHNSIFVGWEKGLHISGSTTFDNFNSTTSLDSMGIIKNSIIASNIFPKFIHDSGGANSSWYNAYAGTNSIDTTQTVAQIGLVSAFPTNLYDNADFRLTVASTASVGADFSGTQFTNQVLGVKQLSKDMINSFVIYPNPATEHSNVAFTMVERNKVTVYVYDVLGNVVSNLTQNNEFEKGNNVINLNTSHLSSGIYYVSLEVNGAKETKKLVINK